VLPAWREILASDEANIVIAGHAGVNRLILCDVSGRPLAGLFDFPQEPGSLAVVDVSLPGSTVRTLPAKPLSTE
jgi:probable phosphoglycerate mutase